MTLLIATITDKVGFLSHDTLVTDVSTVADRPAGFVMKVADSYEAARDSAFVGDGSMPDTIGLGQCSKITIAPHLHLVAGYTGDHALCIQWDAALRHTPLAAEIGDVHSHGVRKIREALKLSPERDAGFSALHIGWSFLRRRIVGYVYTAADGWKGMELPAGHIVSPVSDTDDPGYEELVRRAPAAAQGQDTDLFHVRMAESIHRTFMGGRYVKGALIGGQLHTARVDAEGISVKVAHVFEAGS